MKKKELAQKMIDYNKYSNVRLVVANEGLTLVQQKEVEYKSLRENYETK